MRQCSPSCRTPSLNPCCTGQMMSERSPLFIRILGNKGHKSDEEFTTELVYKVWAWSSKSQSLFQDFRLSPSQTPLPWRLEGQRHQHWPGKKENCSKGEDLWWMSWRCSWFVLFLQEWCLQVHLQEGAQVSPSAVSIVVNPPGNQGSGHTWGSLGFQRTNQSLQDRGWVQVEEDMEEIWLAFRFLDLGCLSCMGRGSAKIVFFFHRIVRIE